MKALNSLKSTLKYKNVADLPPAIRYPILKNPKLLEFYQKKLDNIEHIQEETETNPNVDARTNTKKRVLLKPDFNIKVDLPTSSSNETTYNTAKHVGTPLKKTIEQEVTDMQSFFSGLVSQSFAGFNMEQHQKLQSTIPTESLAEFYKSFQKAPGVSFTPDEIAERVFDSEEFRNYKEKVQQFITQNNIAVPNNNFLYEIPLELEIESSIKQNHQPLLNWMNEQWQIAVNYKKQLQTFHREHSIQGHITQVSKSSDDAKLLLALYDKMEEANLLRLSLAFTTQPCFETRLNEVKPILEKIVKLTTEVDSALLARTARVYPQLASLVEKLTVSTKLRNQFLTSNPEAHLYTIQNDTMNQIHTRYQQENNTLDFLKVVGNSYKNYKAQVAPVYSVQEYNNLKKMILDNIEQLDNDTYGYLQSALENFSSDANLDLRMFEQVDDEDSKFVNQFMQKIKNALKEGSTPFKALFNLENTVDVITHSRRTRSGPELKELLPFYQSKYIGDSKLPVHRIGIKKSYGFNHAGIKNPGDNVVRLTVRLSDIDFSSDIARENFIRLVKGDLKAKYKKRFNEIKQSVTLKAALYDTREENINYLQNLLVELIRAAESFDTLIAEVPSPNTKLTREEQEKKYLEEDAKANEALDAWVRHRKAGKITVGADLTYGEGVKEEVVREEEIVEDYGYTSYTSDDLKDIESLSSVHEDENLSLSEDESDWSDQEEVKEKKSKKDKKANKKNRK